MRIERMDEVAVVRIEAGKANAFSPELVRGLNMLVDELEASDARAAVFTGYDRFFSAGLALPALIDLDRDEMRAFMQSFDGLMERIFRLPIPVVAAINGHAIAGGCVLALQADLRLMAEGDFRIGLNEVQIGLGLPAVVVETLRAQVPTQSLLPLALEGKLVTPHFAMELDLVHEVVPPEELEPRALDRAHQLAALGGAAYAQIKSALRAPALERLRAGEAAEIERWLDTWFSDDARRRLAETLARMGKNHPATM